MFLLAFLSLYYLITLSLFHSLALLTVFGPPTRLFLSNSTYAPPTVVPGYTIGILNATSVNTGDVFSFSIVGGAHASLFQVRGSSRLQFINAGQVGTHLDVTVRVTNLAALTLDVSFEINDR